MRWRVEVVTEKSSNILMDDPTITNPMDHKPVGMGFPIMLAERIVTLHNFDADKAAEYDRENIKNALKLTD